MENLNEIGVKIAENSDEAFWTETKDQCEKAIESHKRNIQISEKILELAITELEKYLKCSA